MVDIITIKKVLLDRGVFMASIVEDSAPLEAMNNEFMAQLRREITLLNGSGDCSLILPDLLEPKFEEARLNQGIEIPEDIEPQKIIFWGFVHIHDDSEIIQVKADVKCLTKSIKNASKIAFKNAIKRLDIKNWLRDEQIIIKS